MRVEPLTAMSKLTHRSIRIGVALALAGVLILVGSGQAFGNAGLEQAPSQYGCDQHPCYGATNWQAKDNSVSEYYGVYADIWMAHFQCSPAACNDATNKWFIDNELWLVDDTCQNRCWVEAGYMISHSAPEEIFFWYDARLINGSGPAFVLPGPVGSTPPLATPTPTIFPRRPTPVATATATSAPAPTTNIPQGGYDQYDHFMIVQDSRITSCPESSSTTPTPVLSRARPTPTPTSPPASFLIFMYNNSANLLLGGVSTCNSMSPGRIKLGQELHGKEGVTADPATFTRNYFALQAINANNHSFVYDIQKNGGIVVQNKPPVGSWNPDPAASSDGGIFSTQCCSVP